MRIIYILLVLMVVASVLGCVSQQSSGVTPAGSSISPNETPASEITSSGNDTFGTQSDINSIDSLLNDSSMDIPLSDATI